MGVCVHESFAVTGRKLGPAALPELRCGACGAKFIRQEGMPDGVVQFDHNGFAMVDFGERSIDPRTRMTRHSPHRIRGGA